MARVNYLNNKDILKEIHKSKASYCYYTDKKKYSDYDLIWHDPIEKITKAKILEARRNRAARLTQIKAEELGLKRKEIPDHEIKLREIKETDDLDRKSNPKTIADTKVKLNFIPFKHYIINEEGSWEEVGKSHYASHNQFSLDHGRMTNKLGMMFMKLCERYGGRSNWRGYTYNDEMRSQALVQLSQIGLQFDESKSQNPFAYYTAAITNSFTRILNVEKKHQSLRDDILEKNGLSPSYTRQLENEMAASEAAKQATKKS